MNESNERWLPVPDYEGLYEVGSHGNVWSAPRATTKGGLLKHIIGKHGYHYVTLTRNGKQRRFAVHRLMMAAFADPCPEGQEVRHLDGNPGNNRWEPGDEAETRAAGGNLIYGTHSRNMLDMADHGTDANLNKTHCPQKHKYTPENTLIFDGRRFCLECKRERGRELWRKNKAAGKIPLIADLSPEEQERKRAYYREYKRRRRSEGKVLMADLSPEEQERRRAYQREYMRRRRAEQKRLHKEGTFQVTG